MNKPDLDKAIRRVARDEGKAVVREELKDLLNSVFDGKKDLPKDELKPKLNTWRPLIPNIMDWFKIKPKNEDSDVDAEKLSRKGFNGKKPGDKGVP